VLTTMLARRAQHHQSKLSAHLNAANPTGQAHLNAIAQTLQAKGLSAADAMHRAYAMIEETFSAQANMLAYVGCFWILGVAILDMIPLVFLMKKPQTGGEMAVH